MKTKSVNKLYRNVTVVTFFGLGWSMNINEVKNEMLTFDDVIVKLKTKYVLEINISNVKNMLSLVNYVKSQSKSGYIQEKNGNVIAEW